MKNVTFVALVIICIATFGGIFFLNQRQPAVVIPKTTTETGAVAVNTPSGQISAPLSGREIAAVTTTGITLLAPNTEKVSSADAPLSYQTIGHIDISHTVSAIAWSGDTLYWTEERAVSDSASAQGSTAFVLVACRFEQLNCSPVDQTIVKHAIVRIIPDTTNTFLGLLDDANDFFVYTIAQGEIKRISQDVVGATFLPGKLSVVVAAEQEPQPVTTYYELSKTAEVKSTTVVPGTFGGFGVTALNEAEVLGVSWGKGAEGVVQRLRLSTNTVTDIGSVTFLKDGATLPSGVSPLPQLIVNPKKTDVLVRLPRLAQVIFTLESATARGMTETEDFVDFIDDSSYATIIDSTLFSVGVQSGIQTRLAGDVVLSAVRATK